MKKGWLFSAPKFHAMIVGRSSGGTRVLWPNVKDLTRDKL